jgi:hypothetical protein
MFRFNCLLILALLLNSSIVNIMQRRVTVLLANNEWDWTWKEAAVCSNTVLLRRLPGGTQGTGENSQLVLRQIFEAGTS